MLFILRMIWNVIATGLHIIGCPESVTSLSCCSNFVIRIRTSISGILNSSRNNNDESDEVRMSGFRTMQTSDNRQATISANAQRFGVQSGRYERISSTDFADVERGLDTLSTSPVNEVNKDKLSSKKSPLVL